MIDSMVFVQTQQLMKLFSAYGRVARGMIVGIVLIMRLSAARHQ